ncbi:class I adenylate-forming enzyme family protein [Rhodopila sp.]|jgi:fatty-acyl-CoA synthase|uniref:class I adenylate-forming enzyme family protein n=1 Tax=Rhodopila sp. TaxID=2480087 RepID=UPI002CB28EE2|nr:AMP-binding protein [Rhodopila sp.]HVZ06295.1 AMP-binding protein [Rhodopila sp.]
MTAPNGIDSYLAVRTSGLTIGELLVARTRQHPDRIAVVDGTRSFSFAAFNARVNRLAAELRRLGIARGDRVAILSENRCEYLELMFAAGKLGVIVCALNWRLADAELIHCITLTSPKATFVSPAHAPAGDRLSAILGGTIRLGDDYEDRLARCSDAEPPIAALPEDGHVILYTSGTTGNPKGALISHRAQIARMHSSCVDFDLAPGDVFVAWAPMFHMVSTDQSVDTLCLGGKVIVIPGYDPDRILHAAETESLWWLVAMPGMIEDLIAAAKRRRTVPKGIKLMGAMADLVPRHQLIEVTSLLRTPYANTFGATETGLPPASAGRVPIGRVPDRLSKIPSASCAIRLVDADGRDVPDGTPGELAIRGPTVFSGYWNAPETNARDFRGGWFHMGDVFVRNPDGTIDFVDRVKYMIKSGGENIYPAEIEQVLLRDPRVADAVVVRAPDPRWGEVPVAFVARRDEALTEDDLVLLCRTSLAGYKRPKAVRFVALDDLPRSTTGKIQRHELEKRLSE